MKNIKLNDEDMQSLKMSLLGFVRRVSFHGADSPEEAETLPILVSLLLGESWLFDGEKNHAFVHEEETESYCAQESENSGTGVLRECGCRRCFECTE